MTSYPCAPSGATTLLLGLMLSACGMPTAPVSSPATAEITLAEQPVIPLPLAGPITDPQAEISGMAWYGDYLVMLPQYPERFAVGDVPQIFALPKATILAALEGNSGGLEPLALPFMAPDFGALVPGFQGFEAIGFAAERVFLTIEAESAGTPAGYLVRGQMVGNLEGLHIEPGNLTAIPSQSGVSNMAEEALMVVDNEVLTLHEVNGAALNPNPVAHRFSLAPCRFPV